MNLCTPWKYPVLLHTFSPFPMKIFYSAKVRLIITYFQSLDIVHVFLFKGKILSNYSLEIFRDQQHNCLNTNLRVNFLRLKFLF